LTPPRAFDKPVHPYGGVIAEKAFNASRFEDALCEFGIRQVSKRANGEGSSSGENMWARAENPRFPVRLERLDLLGRAISEYDKVVDEEERRG